MVLYAWYLILYTYLQPIGDLPGGNGVKVQVLLSSKAVISLYMASLHLENWTAWWKEASSDGVVVIAITKEWKVRPWWE